MPARCAWVTEDPLYIRYHDHEWGTPLRDEHALFELLTLEGAQAGLSWITVLRKRARYREVFEGFDPERVARFSDAHLESLLRDPGIIRNRLKVHSTRDNARALIAVADRHGSFSDYLWQAVEQCPVVGHWRTVAEVPATTALSRRLSHQLRKEGFRFVGPTICYAFMQASGMVMDHTVDCFRYPQLAGTGLR